MTVSLIARISFRSESEGVVVLVRVVGLYPRILMVVGDVRNEA